MNRFILPMIALFSSFIISFANADTFRVIDFETIDKGSSSKYDNDMFSHLIEIYSKDHWESFWEKHTHTGVPNSYSRALPYIDFGEYYVLVALDQARGSGGYEIEIKAIDVDATHKDRPATIITEIKQPGKIGLKISIMTRPYHIIKIKK